MVRLILIRVHQLIVFLRIIVPHLHIIKELALILQLPIRDHQLKEISGGGTTEFSFDFSVPNSVRSGDYTTISLPNELDFTRDQSFNVYAPDGTTTVASAIINKEKKTLVLTYTDYVDTHDDVTGHINMQIMADTEKVKKDTILPATIKINGM